MGAIPTGLLNDPEMEAYLEELLKKTSVTAAEKNEVRFQQVVDTGYVFVDDEPNAEGKYNLGFARSLQQ